MATAELSMGKLAEMGKVASVNGQTQPVPVKVNPTKRYQHKIDLLTRRWKIEQDISRALNTLVERYDQLTRKQKAENSELRLQLAVAEKGWNKALDLRDQYQAQLRQRVKNPPLTPNFHERETR